MASHNLSSFFFLLLAFVLLILSPQTQAGQGKFFSFFSHFTTTSHKLKSHHPHSPSPSPSPSSSESIAATPESILAAPAPESSTEADTTLVPSPAESEFLDRGDGYGLYGTTSFENNNDNHESFKTDWDDEESKAGGYGLVGKLVSNRPINRTTFRKSLAKSRNVRGKLEIGFSENNVYTF
ncbi:hypothetical protein K1719_038656 [Acacia pycnantha]|nr:hypothetical protein K1719_038656 [Acacia pycnantha]